MPALTVKTPRPGYNAYEKVELRATVDTLRAELAATRRSAETFAAEAGRLRAIVDILSRRLA